MDDIIEQRVKIKTANMKAAFFTVLAYDAFISLLELFTTEACRNDLKSFFSGLFVKLRGLFDISSDFIQAITNTSGIVPTLMTAVLMILAIILIGIILQRVYLRFKAVFKKALCNLRTSLFILLTMAIIVFLGEYIRLVIDFNLFGIFLIVNAAYIIVSLIMTQKNSQV